MTPLVDITERFLNLLLVKAFCPTGLGGGIDNSCGGPGGGGGGIGFKNNADPFVAYSAPKRIKAALKGMGPELNEMLSGLDVELVDSVGDVVPSQSRAQGLHTSIDGKTTRILVGMESGGGFGARAKNKFPEETAVHELGHAFDLAYISQEDRGRIASQFRAEYKKLPEDVRSRMSHYALNDKESFAHTFQRVYGPGKPVVRVTNDEFRQKFPKTVQAFSDVMLGVFEREGLM